MRNRKNTGKGQKVEEQHGSRKRQENLLGKVRLEEPTKEMTRRTKKNGRKVQREAPVNRPVLLDLLAELLEEIFVRIRDLEDVIALSATCRRLAALIEHLTPWRPVLPKIQLVERGTVWRGRRGWVSMEGHGLIWKHCRPCQTMPST